MATFPLFTPYRIGARVGPVPNLGSGSDSGLSSVQTLSPPCGPARTHQCPPCDLFKVTPPPRAPPLTSCRHPNLSATTARVPNRYSMLAAPPLPRHPQGVALEDHRKVASASRPFLSSFASNCSPEPISCSGPPLVVSNLLHRSFFDEDPMVSFALPPSCSLRIENRCC